MNSIVLVLVLVLDIFRYLPSGNFDTTFGTNGIVTNSVPAGTGGLEGVVIQPADGKIVTVGTANNLTELTVSRYLARWEEIQKSGVRKTGEDARPWSLDIFRRGTS
jgi:hypothetical protein